MRCLPECYPCLRNLARRCASLAAADPQKHDEALESALAYLEENFSLDRISISLAGELQRIIRLKSGNDDPFAAVKREETALARHYAERFAPPAQASLQELVQFAAKGNGFDFFQDLQTLEKQFQAPVEFARDDTAALEELLQSYRSEGGKKIIYLVFFRKAKRSYGDLPAEPLPMKIGMTMLSAAIVGIGLFPNQILDRFILPALTQFKMCIRDSP